MPEFVSGLIFPRRTCENRSHGFLLGRQASIKMRRDCLLIGFLSLCVFFSFFFALNMGIRFSSACIYSTVWIKDFQQSRVGGGSSADCSLSASPTGRTHPFKLSDDGPNPQLALLNHRSSPQNFLSFPLWKRSLF